MSFLSKAGMSVSQSGFTGWGVGVGLGEDERTRPATDRGAWRGAAWPAHHHLGRHGAGAERTAGASAAGGLGREHGAGGLTHRARGRRANNRIKDAVREHAIELVRTNYPDFGPMLAAEVLAEKHDLVVSRETLRTWMTTAGLWLSRRQRRHFHTGLR